MRRPLLQWRLRTIMLAVAVIAAGVFVAREWPVWAAYYHSWRKNRPILAQLERTIPPRFPNGVPFEDVLKHIKGATVSPNVPDGIPIYIDTTGLQEADTIESAPVKIDARGIPLRASLNDLLRPLGLSYYVEDGLLTITAAGREGMDRIEPPTPEGDGARCVFGPFFHETQRPVREYPGSGRLPTMK